ncbi:MAG: amino acid adenylation domain-containing protein, partial [Acidimicrobiia bacterium]
WNGYGPTEATIATTFADLAAQGDPGTRYTTIGRPLATARGLVLDRRLIPVPIGVPGELYLGGPQVAEGYLNRPELTEKKFVADPLGSDGTYYRTGDLVRWRPDGNLEDLGRMDRQVKVRGHRVEVAEIEGVIGSLEGVVEVAVTQLTGEGGDRGLAAFVVVDGELDPNTIAHHASLHLPGYMVPGHIEIRDGLPHLASGKIDVRALIPTAPARGEESHVAPAPADQLTVRLCELWSDVLERPVGPDDDFFRLGGHSLLAVRLFSQIDREWGASPPMPTLFEAPTPRALAARLRILIDGNRAASGGIPRRNATRAPLSHAQRRLWFLEMLRPGTSAYHVPWRMRLRGALDEGALEAAIDGVVARHEVLRTRFLTEDGIPYQLVDPPSRVTIERHDLSAEPDGHREERLAALVEEIESRPFDLGADLMMRAALIRLGLDEHGLLLVAHHIATDGASFAILRTELAEIYRAARAGSAPDLPGLPIQYADYAAWQRERIDSAADEESLRYWTEKLSGPLPVLALPTDRARPAEFSYRGDWTSVDLEPAAAGRFLDTAAEAGATPFMALVAALAATLSRYTGDQDVIVGSPSTERTMAETENLIGFFVNTLPLRSDVSGDPSFRTLLDRVRDTVVEAFGNSSIPFEAIVEQVEPGRDPSRSPIFQVMCAMTQGSAPRFELDGLVTSSLGARTGDPTTKFDLTVFGHVDGAEISLSLGYNTDIFDAETVKELAHHLAALLAAATEHPDVPLSRLDLLTPNERRWLVTELNDTQRSYPSERRIHEVVAEIAADRRNEIAVSENGTVLTYGELVTAATDLASRLEAAGVRPGDTVGLGMGRSAGLIVAMLATLMADACYVPLDPSYPDDRLGLMREDAGLRALVGHGPDGYEVTPLGPHAAPRFGDDAPAYVMYTSGSTGRPKGVAIPHRAVLSLVCNADYAPLTDADVVAHASNTSFDASTWEVWGALLNGSSIAVLDNDTVTSPQRLADAIRSEGVTAMFVTTALFNSIAAVCPDAFATVDRLLFGGEAVDPRSVATILDTAPPRTLVHVYGPTEATTFAAWHEVEDVPLRARTIPIGLPIVNTSLHVLDAAMDPLPVGVVGELYIGGEGLAQGYVGDEELTQQRFVDDPFSTRPGARLYRTGDLVRRRRDGAIEYHGRADRQVKLRGFRIEPGEVEARLRDHPGVASALVRVWGRGQDRRLVAYLVPSPGAEIDVAALGATARSALPRHAVPGHFVVLDELPMTPNGKIDTGALPDPTGVTAAEHQPARGEAMLAMAEIWQDVLGASSVGATDDFFLLGGHSLLAVELMAAVERRFGAVVPLSTLFEAPTLAEFTRRTVSGTGSGPASQVVQIRGGSEPPLFCMHPGGGNIFSYAPLSRYLGPRQGVVGIQARGADGIGTPHRTIEEMAEAYVGLIVATQPTGPYHLAGYSLGGTIAYETARRLVARGHDVALLALMDTTLAGGAPFIARLARRVRMVITGGNSGRENVKEEVRVSLRRLGGRLRHGPKWTYYRIRRRPIPPALAGKRLTHIGIAAHRKYRPPRDPYDGTIIYFRAKGLAGEVSARPDTPWRALAAHVEVVGVPGFHTGDEAIIQEPYAATLGIELRKRIERSRTGRT